MTKNDSIPGFQLHCVSLPATLFKTHKITTVGLLNVDITDIAVSLTQSCGNISILRIIAFLEFITTFVGANVFKKCSEVF